VTDRIEKAIEELKKAIAIKPSAQSYALLGAAYQRQGKFDEAKQGLTWGLSLTLTIGVACSTWV